MSGLICTHSVPLKWIILILKRAPCWTTVAASWVNGTLSVTAALQVSSLWLMSGQDHKPSRLGWVGSEAGGVPLQFHLWSTPVQMRTAGGHFPPRCPPPCPDPACFLQPITLPTLTDYEVNFSKGSAFGRDCIFVWGRGLRKEGAPWRTVSLLIASISVASSLSATSPVDIFPWAPHTFPWESWLLPLCRCFYHPLHLPKLSPASKSRGSCLLSH